MSRLRTPLIAALLAVAVAVVVTTGALAEGGSPAATLYTASVKNQWSTINVCDTKAHPDQLGIRARMPALKRGDKMKMRFFVEWKRNGAWVALPTSDGGKTMSDWFVVGYGKYKWEELGDTFHISKLRPGDNFLMRGLVKFQWRRHGEVVKRAHAYTSGGHHQQDYGDPRGFSAATCNVSGSY